LETRAGVLDFQQKKINRKVRKGLRKEGKEKKFSLIWFFGGFRK
jgi:hypothetical protein